MIKDCCAYSFLEGKRLQLGVTGSVAAYKSFEIMRSLQRLGVKVGVTVTRSGQYFVTPEAYMALSAEPVFTKMFAREEGPFGHLYPGGEADAFAIVPATATTISRIAQGSAEEILSAQALAWSGPIVLAPAMNPRMWANPANQANIDTLVSRGHIIVTPGTGLVACGDEGQGRLADERDILFAIISSLCPQDFKGWKVMVTLGPTREEWDGVRYWTNHSTGAMGAAIAVAAAARGAEVHAVCGPGSPWLPAVINRYDVVSAREMHAQSLSLWPGMQMGVFTAAVADFSPEPHGKDKFKKAGNEKGFKLNFSPNPDILQEIGAQKNKDQKIIGFAAETGDLHDQVKKKLRRKMADIIVGNLVGKKDSGFGHGLNTVFVADSSGREEDWPALPKPEVAWRILEWASLL